MGTYWTIGFPFDSAIDLAAGMAGNPNIAIIAPLKYLVPQAVNLSCFDTMIIGELDLRSIPNVAVLVPKNAKVELGDVSQLKVVEYDDSTVQHAVQSYLKIHFAEYVLQPRASGRENFALDKEGRDLNRFQNFQSILADHPHISFGWSSSSVGGLAYLVEAASTVFHEMDFVHEDKNRYLIEGLAKLVPILERSFRALDGTMDRKAIRAALDLADMAQSKLKIFKCESCTADGFRKLPLEDRFDVVSQLAIGEIDLRTLYATDHWAFPYIKIMDDMRGCHHESVIGQCGRFHKFESPFDPELESLVRSRLGSLCSLQSQM